MSNLALNLDDIFGGEPAANVELVKCPPPGIYQDIPNKVYHSLPAVSNSYLSRFNKCPAAAKVAVEESANLILGSATHAFVLEGEEAFLKEFAVAPYCDKRTKAGKETFAEFQDANKGKAVITADEMQLIICMGNAVHAHPFASQLLKQGISEQSVFWQDEETGLYCKCRPDRIPSGNKGVLVDLKTTTDASEHAFTRSITVYGYHRQAAMYLDGVNAARRTNDTGDIQDFDAFAFIAVEKTEPYRVEVFVLLPDFIEAGREDYKRLLRQERTCRRNSFYPNYQNPGIIELSKPGWL